MHNNFNQTLMKELSLFLSIDNFAKFDASCQLHLNPRKYQTWFSCCIFRLEQVHQWWSSTTWRWTTTRERSGWAPPSATRSLNAPEWKRWKKTVLRRRIKKSTLTSRCSSSCSCSSWSESSLLLQRSLWQTLPLSNPLGKNRFLLFFFVKMSAFVDVDGGLLMSSTRVGNAICSFDSLAGCC